MGVVLAGTVAPVHAAEIDEVAFLSALDASHPAVVALTDELARAEGELRSAGALDNPTLDVEYEVPSDQAEQTTLKLGWKPPLDGRRGLAKDAGEAGVEVARQRLEWARLQVRDEMRAVFAAWSAAERKRALVRDHLEALRALEARLNVRAERGEESALAARRFALAVTEVRAALAQSEAELSAARARARALHAGLPDDAVASLPEPPAAPRTIDGADRPDLLARRGEVRRAELRRRLAGRVVEFPSLVAGWTRIADDETYEGPFLGLSWDVPLFDRAQGDRHVAAREVAIAEARLRLEERSAASQRSAALVSYATLLDGLTEVRAVVQDAPQLVDVASASFLAGESSMTDLLETLRSVLESQLSALDLHLRVLEAHRELEMSAGHALTRGDSR